MTPRFSFRPVRRLVRLGGPSVITVAVLSFGPLNGLETSLGLQTLYTLRGVRPAPPDVVIVSIDAASARDLDLPERLDRWPRPLHAELVRRLGQCGTGVIGFDVLFHHPRDEADDLRLIEAVRQAGNVALVEAVTREPVKDAQGRTLGTVDRRLRPLPALAEAAYATAPMVMPKTEDGVFEYWSRVPTLADLPSLPVVMARRLGHAPPADAGDRALLNFYGPLGTLTTLRFSEALAAAGEASRCRATFGGKAVLVGLSEDNQSRQFDAYRTPYTTEDGVDVSGVELGATALANVLDGSALRRPSAGARVLGLAGWTALLSLPWSLLPLAWAAGLTGAAALAAAAFGLWAFGSLHLWLPVVAAALVAPLAAAGFGLLQQGLRARRRRASMEQAMDLGVTREGLERMLHALGDFSSGQTLEAVCLYSDIEGYTRLSETLTPAQTRDALNQYYQHFLPVVHAHGGHVADTVGDSIMCMWPAHANPAEACLRACEAALALDRLFNPPPGEPRVPGTRPTRFGLHLGPVFLGAVGARRHREIRAVGDLVNTTSRIQGANKPLGTRVLASRAVTELCPRHAGRPLGRFQMAGKSQPLELVQIGPAGGARPAEAWYARGLEAFQRGQAQAAIDAFTQALGLEPGTDGPAAFMLEQARALRDSPPQDPLSWDGRVVLRDK